MLAAAPPAAPPAYVFVILDIGGIHPQWVTGDPEGCPAFRTVAREGVTVLRLRSTETDHLKALRTFVTTETGSLLGRAVKRSTPEQVWLLAPHAGRTAELADGARFFAPDFKHPALHKLVDRYGLPRTLAEGDLAQIGTIRALYGPGPIAGERELALLLTGHGTVNQPDIVVLRRLTQLIRDEKATFVVAVLSDADVAHRDVGAAQAAVRATDQHLGEIWALLNQEPYLSRSVFAYISLLGRTAENVPSGHQEETESFAILVAPGFRKGFAVTDPVPAKCVQTALLHALGMAEPGAAKSLPDGILKK